MYFIFMNENRKMKLMKLFLEQWEKGGKGMRENNGGSESN
jgi:hypothetical protein